MARILKLFAKIVDHGEAEYVVDKKTVFKGEDNSGFPCLNKNIEGEYIDLHIDIDTGEIVNWAKPSKKSVQEMIDNHDEEKQEEDRQRIMKEIEKEKKAKENKFLKTLIIGAAFKNKKTKEKATIKEKYDGKVLITVGKYTEELSTDQFKELYAEEK